MQDREEEVEDLSTNIEEAIKNAIEYETKVKNVYKESEAQATDQIGKRVLSILAEEEQRHLDFLEYKLEEWQKNGAITHERLETVIPSKEVIDAEVNKLRDRMHEPSRHADKELKMLKRALQVEIETSEFYKRMVRELPVEGQRLFSRFV